MSNSNLVVYTRISPNRTSPRNHAIDRITIHCAVGQVTAERLGEIFAPKSRGASSNYGVDKDGRIGMYCEEKDRSWCSSTRENDNRAITIEVASDNFHPYRVTDKAYNALIELCVDICQRNGKKKLLWFGDKTKTLNYVPKSDEMVMTVHRWFANKSCPGDYLYNLHGDIANRVTEKLGSAQPDTEQVPEDDTVPFKVKVIIDDLNIREEPNMSAKVVGVTGKGVFTIVETQNGWGRLKSGAGWIYIDNPRYVTKL